MFSNIANLKCNITQSLLQTYIHTSRHTHAETLARTPPCCTITHAHGVRSIKGNILAISSDTHQLHYIPLHHFIQYNHNNYMTRYLGRNEILNKTNNEFYSAAMFPVWHELSRLRRGQINVAGICRREET